MSDSWYNRVDRRTREVGINENDDSGDAKKTAEYLAAVSELAAEIKNS